MHAQTRRSFLIGSLPVAMAGAGWYGSQASVAPVSRMPYHTVRLGGPYFGEAQDPEEMARALRGLEYAAAYCPDVELGDTARIRAIVEAFERHQVVIAEVGRWVNLLEADTEKRAQNLQKVIDGLALAEEVGALCCVDIAGSFSTKEWYGPHPDNLSERFFEAAVENARKIIDAVRPRRAKFCYEMMGWAIPDSADSYLRLIRAVERKGFGVHFDPCNLINCPERFYRSADLVRDCCEKLGRYIVSCHAKDLTWDVEMNVHFREVRPGTGSLDYEVYLRELAKLPQRPPLMLEHHADAKEYDQARQYVLDTGRKSGIKFG